MGRDNPKVFLRNTRKYGRGVFARRAIRRGEVIAAFDGPIYDDLFDAWTEDLLGHAIQIGKALWRDSVGLARYINHSCEPNCGIKNYIQIVAMRPIAAGEELSWDYEMTEKSPWMRMKCQCGSVSCRRVIGNYSRMPRAVRARYKGYISEWLLRKADRGGAKIIRP